MARVINNEVPGRRAETRRPAADRKLIYWEVPYMAGVFALDAALHAFNHTTETVLPVATRKIKQAWKGGSQIVDGIILARTDIEPYQVLESNGNNYTVMYSAGNSSGEALPEPVTTSFDVVTATYPPAHPKHHQSSW